MFSPQINHLTLLWLVGSFALLWCDAATAGLVTFNDVDVTQLTAVSPIVVEAKLEQTLSGESPYYLFKVDKVLKQHTSRKQKRVEKGTSIIVRTAGFLMGKLAARAFARSGQLRSYSLHRFIGSAAKRLREKQAYLLFLVQPPGSPDYEFSARNGYLTQEQQREISSIIRKQRRRPRK